jgi:nicotinate-nucleotide--dimethylbenzimidazole phosphoribosyltransferase
MPSSAGKSQNLPEIPPLDADAIAAAEDRQAILTKPAGALGRLEALSVRLAGMTGQATPRIGPDRKALVICAGDHGVAAQGVSAYPQAVTAQMVANFLTDGAAANVLARQMGARVVVVDAGVASELPSHADLVSGKIAPGTADISQGPAMTRRQATAALQLGLDIADNQISLGLDLLAAGEMGIANTTPASALISALTGHPPAETVGRGTGIDDNALAHKVEVVQRALQANQSLDTADGMSVLAALGGFEIGAMAGLMLGAAAARVPAVIDGLISTAAALVAQAFRPRVTDYLIAGHRSTEPGHIYALSALGLEPLLDLGLRLGEGTGALLAFPVVEAAARTLSEMATFAEAGVSDKDQE